MKNKKQKLMSVALALACATTMNGCAQKIKGNTNPTGIPSYVTHDYYSGKEEYNSYLFNPYYFGSEVEEANKIGGIENGMVTEYKEYGTTLLNGMTSAFYLEWIKYIVWPETLCKPNEATLSNGNVDYDVKITELNDNEYVIISINMEAKKDLAPSLDLFEVGKYMCEGDYIHADILIKKGEIVAYKQTGIGSDAANVPVIGDFDEAVKTYEELGCITEDTTIELVSDIYGLVRENSKKSK